MDRRNMEPPGRVYNTVDGYFEQSTCFNHAIDIGYGILMHVEINFQQCSALRIRGGMDNPSADEKSSEIPYLTNQKFSWDGLPCIDFIEKIMLPLENGLATMTVKGYSLLDACNQTDAGGVLGVPPRAAAPPDVIAESIHRNKKAFACIMNYISRNSWFYKNAHRLTQLQQNGIHTLQAIRNHGIVILPPRLLKAREDAWARMTMESLRIPNDIRGYFKWMDIVMEAGRKQGKDGEAQLNKWIEGLPSWFGAEKAQIRHDRAAALMFPATYAGIYPGSPGAATAHPMVGQPNVMAYAKKYLPDWCQRSMAVSKEDMKVYQISMEIYAVDDIDGVVNLLKSFDIRPDTDCYLCGGKGHAASQVMPDGTTLVCPTRILNEERKDSGQHSKQVGSSNEKMRKKYNGAKERIALLQEQILELTDHINSASFGPNNSKTSRKGSFKRRPHANSATDDSDALDPELECSTQDDAESDDSDASHIQDFADAVSFREKKPMKKKH